METNKDLEQYANKLMKMRNFPTDTEPEVLAEIEKELYDQLERALNVTILEKLPMEKLPEFQKLVTDDNPAAIQAFCEKEIPNMQDVIKNTLVRFGEIYLEKNK